MKRFSLGELLKLYVFFHHTNGIGFYNFNATTNTDFFVVYEKKLDLRIKTSAIFIDFIQFSILFAKGQNA